MTMQYFHRYSGIINDLAASPLRSAARALAYVHTVQLAAVQLAHRCMPQLLTAGALFSHTDGKGLLFHGFRGGMFRRKSTTLAKCRISNQLAYISLFYLSQCIRFNPTL